MSDNVLDVWHILAESIGRSLQHAGHFPLVVIPLYDPEEGDLIPGLSRDQSPEAQSFTGMLGPVCA